MWERLEAVVAEVFVEEKMVLAMHDLVDNLHDVVVVVDYDVDIHNSIINKLFLSRLDIQYVYNHIN